jgi:APA family basic amino acid/polyamine antiporter
MIKTYPMAVATHSVHKQHELPRALNVSHATAIVVGTIIGSGIFLVPQEMTQAVGSAKLVYLAWIVGGILSLFGALTYAELGAMKPDAGGEYVYVRDAYGPLPGFLYMWTWFILAKPASIASVTTGIMRVLGSFAVFSFLPHTAFSIGSLAVTYAQLGAMLATLLISGLNYIGVRKAGNFQLFFTWLKVLMIVATAAIAFSYAGGSWHNYSTTFTGATGGFAGFMTALVAALWAYDGWNDLNMVAGEVSEPQRSIPIALIVGVTLVGVLYMLTNAAVQYVLPSSAIAASSSPSALSTTVAIGAIGGSIVAAGMALSMFVTLNGTIMSGARVPFAVARDGYFFRALSEVHPRFRTPSVSIVVQAAVALLLLLLVGKFQALFSLAIFAEWLFYMIATSTVFVFRRREPNATRPYRTWGYPLVPAIFILCSAVLLYYTFTENLRNSIYGSAVILLGVPLFIYFARTKDSAQRLGDTE